jgi:DNA-binding SARP family transcriptional activator/tetratricopeptide (TPR) repeat protein
MHPAAPSGMINGMGSPPGRDPDPRRTIRLRVLGTFAVEIDGATAGPPRTVSRKARTLLKLLATDRSRPTTTDRAVEVLWPDGPPAQPVENLATLVSRIRSWLGPAAIEGGRDGYRLAPHVPTDLEAAESLTGQAERALAAGHSGVALVPAEQACALLAHDLLDDEPYATWADPARQALATLRRRARLIHVRAALDAGEPSAAVTTASTGLSDDPLDEELARALMTAHRANAEPAKALAAYAALRHVLADELGTDPASETEALHQALLRDQPVPAQSPAGPAPRTKPTAQAQDHPDLVERDTELDHLRAAWGAAATGHPSLQLVVGEAGIGKTSLAEALTAEVVTSGGRLLRTRCYQAERSLFLQPLVDAVTPAVQALTPHRLRELAGPHADALASLVPAAALALGSGAETGHRAEEARRRAFEALLHLLRRLSEQTPTVLLLDDLHNAGATTVEAVHYLARRSTGARMLFLGTVRREEGAQALAVLDEVATLTEPGPLTADGVARLAEQAGLPDRAQAVADSTRGHPFFVAEVLRGLQAGTESLPESLQAAVLARVTRAGDSLERVLRAAAVLSAEVDPTTVAALLDLRPEDAAGPCEQALAARLLTVTGRAYEFANDLIREVLYETTPAPTRVAWHRRAADLAGSNHEAMAHHAEAAGEPARAARAWLLAAEGAYGRVALSDAVALATRAVDVAPTGTTEVLGRALLVRARALEAREGYAEAFADLQRAEAVARESGDLRLEMTVQRGLAGDVPVALGHGTRACDPYVDRGLVLARSLGDRAAEADLLARRAVIASNRLRLSDALAAGEAAVAAARSSGDETALISALDGLKTALFFLGDVRAMAEVLDELEPALRRRGDLWRLQWCVFESAFVAVADADWERAEQRMRAAAEINRRSGYQAYGTWFDAYLGWLLRRTGRLDEALEIGRRAVAAAVGARHPWWRSTACYLLAGTLAEVGEEAEAADLLTDGLALAEQDGSEAYLMACRSLLADVSGDRDALLAADAMLRDVQAPEGRVWMVGAEAYLALARAWVAAGEPARAADVLGQVADAARTQGWESVLELAQREQAAVARAISDPAER